MTESRKDDFFYVCSLIEYVARVTKNKRGVIANKLGEAGFVKELKDAGLNLRAKSVSTGQTTP